MALLFLAAIALADPADEAMAALKALNAKAPAVGYTFLLDSSAAMKTTADGLRGDIAAVVEAAPAGDVIEVIAYHLRPFVAFPPTVISESNRVDLAKQIRELDLPSGYDHDLGAGLDQLAHDLARKDAPKFQHAFVIGTFCHAPTVSSPWSSGGRGCSPIRNQVVIGQQVAELREQGRIAVRLFPVSAETVPVDAAGLDATVRELGGTVITDGPNSWLPNWRSRLLAERIAPLVASDAKTAAFVATVVKAPTSEDPVATVELKSTALLLDMGLSKFTVTGSGVAVAADVVLSPALRLDLPVAVPRAPLSFFPRHDTVDVTMTFSGDGELGPAPVLKFYGFDGRRSGLKASVVVPIARSYGLRPVTGALVLLALFAVSGMSAVFLRGRFMPLRLGGDFSFRARGGLRNVISVGERAEAAFVFGDDGGVSLCKPDDASVIIRVKRPIWRMSAFVVVRAPGIEINGKPASPGTHAVVPGAVSIRFGETRLYWE